MVRVTVIDPFGARAFGVSTGLACQSEQQPAGPQRAEPRLPEQEVRLGQR
jgi:hypothetical protein